MCTSWLGWTCFRLLHCAHSSSCFVTLLVPDRKSVQSSSRSFSPSQRAQSQSTVLRGSRFVALPFAAHGEHTLTRCSRKNGSLFCNIPSWPLLTQWLPPSLRRRISTVLKVTRLILDMSGWVIYSWSFLKSAFLTVSCQLNVIRILSVSVATFSILMFYATLKTHISQHKPLTKLIALKLIVGLVFLENVCCPKAPTAYLRLT